MKLHQAIETAKAKSANNAKWSRAIEKAAASLLAGELRVHIFDGFALVVNKSGEVYKVNGHCECKAAAAGMACYHRAAARLVEMMEARPAVEPKTERKSTMTRSAGWFGRRDGDAMIVNGWLV